MSQRIVNDPSQHGWVEVDGKWIWGASGGSGGGAGMVISETEPTDKAEGMMWMDTSGAVAMVFIWDGSAWLEMPGSGNVTPKTPDITGLEYLVIGGGGAGGSADGYRGGGGGAGGYRTNVVGDPSGGNAAAEDPYPTIPSGTVIDVVVGAGGYGTGTFTSAFAEDSAFDSAGVVKEITSLAGGTGGNDGTGGQDGGSAGGAFAYYNCPTASGTPGQGWRGGAENTGNYGAGGGGGAGGPGGTSSDDDGGNGGDGRVSSIDGLNKARAGGGGGGGTTTGGGFATAGGANGTGGDGKPAEANTGGGGGGCNTNPGAGGSGVVIVRYKSNFPLATGGDITQNGEYVVHTFNSSGQFRAG